MKFINLITGACLLYHVFNCDLCIDILLRLCSALCQWTPN